VGLNTCTGATNYCNSADSEGEEGITRNYKQATCNEMKELQAVITGEICNSGDQALQDAPVITCNSPTHKESGDYTAPEKPGLCERINRYSVPNVLNPATAIEELSWEERGERHEALVAEIKARMPRRCGSCGSDVTPLFWATVDVWRCDDDSCGAICSGRGG
jgi:hypothetical protein